jgi:hypothetical protein
MVWGAICFGVIIPHANGGAPSLFASRYQDAVFRLTTFPAEVLHGRPVLPVPDYFLRYVWHLFAGTGFLALLGPLPLAVAAPAVAINGLSGSVWQHEGGAHYSAEVVPAFVVAAIFGARRLAQLARRRWGIAPAMAAVPVALFGLAGSLLEARSQAILPPSRRFAWPAPSAHAAHLAPLLGRIPPDAAVSAQSNVYPHVSARAAAYVFPAVDDATYVLVDADGTSDPLGPDELFAAVQRLLADPRFELLAGEDGFLLFRRLPSSATTNEPLSMAPPAQPPPGYFTFALPPVAPAFVPARGSFGGLLDVVGYRIEALPEVSFFQRRAVPTVYFRARQPLDADYRLTTFIVGPGRRGTIARSQDVGNATQRWYPTSRWRPGDLVRVRYPPLTYGPGDRLGMGVQIGTAAVVPRLHAAETDRPALDGGFVVEVAALP